MMNTVRNMRVYNTRRVVPAVRGPMSGHIQGPDNPWTCVSSYTRRTLTCNGELDTEDSL